MQIREWIAAKLLVKQSAWPLCFYKMVLKRNIEKSGTLFLNWCIGSPLTSKACILKENVSNDLEWLTRAITEWTNFGKIVWIYFVRTILIKKFHDTELDRESAKRENIVWTFTLSILKLNFNLYLLILLEISYNIKVPWMNRKMNEFYFQMLLTIQIY